MAYANSDYLLVDETDILDVTRTLAGTRQGLPPDLYDTGPLIQTRERRRILGDHVLRYADQLAGRRYPDSIVLSSSDYDSHGYPSSPLFALLPHDERSRRANHPAPGGSCFTPYRCLLPRGLDGILVAGLGISMERDATAMVRMQYDIQNQGYAAGLAAAAAVRAGCQPRAIDIRALQRQLVELGSIPPEVLDDCDSFPLSPAEIADAVRAFPRATNPAEAASPLAILLTHPGQARPLLEGTLPAASSDAERLAIAKALAVLGAGSVAPLLAAELDRIEQWDAKIFQGRMADYAHLPTPVDALIVALGYAGDRAAAPSILRLLDKLDAGVTLSHHRAVALALERLGDPRAAPALAGLLRKPGMTGHTLEAIEPVSPASPERRTEALREIVLARALFRCGDADGLGRSILSAYARDVRGLFALHARAVLGLKPSRARAPQAPGNSPTPLPDP